MPLQQKTFSFITKKPIEIIEMTTGVKEFVESSGYRNGLLTVSSPHTTLGVVINERCERLQEDMIDFLRRLVPAGGDYRHNQVALDGRPNAHSHLLSLLLPSQLTFVVSEGQLLLGEWQSVFAIELDGPRSTRKIQMTLMEV